MRSCGCYRTYPSLGYDMVRQVPGLADAGEIVYAHMERCDGSGYPRRLKDAGFRSERGLLRLRMHSTCSFRIGRIVASWR
jgi:hypothetical protein